MRWIIGGFVAGIARRGVRTEAAEGRCSDASEMTRDCVSPHRTLRQESEYLGTHPGVLGQGYRTTPANIAKPHSLPLNPAWKICRNQLLNQ